MMMASPAPPPYSSTLRSRSTRWEARVTSTTLSPVVVQALVVSKTACVKLSPFASMNTAGPRQDGAHPREHHHHGAFLEGERRPLVGSEAPPEEPAHRRETSPRKEDAQACPSSSG